MFKLLYRNSEKTNRTKYFYWAMVALNYAMYPALIALLAIERDGATVSQQITEGFALVGGKEIFSFTVSIFVFGLGEYVKVWKKYFRKKTGWLVMLAGWFGGPIGYTLYTISILMVGGALAGTLIALVAPFSAIMERVLLKRKIGKLPKIGILLSGIGAAMLGIMPAVTGGFDDIDNPVLGIIIALFAALSIALEGVLFDVIYTKRKDILPNDAIKMKLTGSTLAMPLLFIPLASLAVRHDFTGYHSIERFFTSANDLWGILVIAIFIFLARFFYLKTINLSGGTVANVMYNLASVITPILILILGSIFSKDLKPEILYTWYFWVFIWFLVAGSILTSFHNKTEKKDKKPAQEN